MNIRPYTDALRKQTSWRKMFESSSGGMRVVCFEKRVDEHRVLELQLWANDSHRISHFYDGSMNTLPTEFSDVRSMLIAIERETSRTDNRKHPFSKGD